MTSSQNGFIISTIDDLPTIELENSTAKNEEACLGMDNDDNDNFSSSGAT